MAGLGSRFFNSGYIKPKPLVDVFDSTIVEMAVKSLNIDGEYIFITREFENKTFNEELEKVLKKVQPECNIVTVKKVTGGATETCLQAKEFLDPDDEVIITNCDQFLDWDSKKFLSFSRNYDAALLTYNSKDPKNSFALCGPDNLLERVAEKEVISNTALVGVHYWKKAKYFLESADSLLKSMDPGGLESYVSLTYNHLLALKRKVGVFDISPGRYYSLGTPEDLKKYKGIRSEFKSEKLKTIFCDLDGTVIEHKHSYSSVVKDTPSLLEGVLDKFDQWDSQGHKIILVTARKESARNITEHHLENLGIPYDLLIMGVTSGERILINDNFENNQPDRAQSINIETNLGFKKVDWSKYGL